MNRLSRLVVAASLISPAPLFAGEPELLAEAWRALEAETRESRVRAREISHKNNKQMNAFRRALTHLAEEASRGVVFISYTPPRASRSPDQLDMDELLKKFLEQHGAQPESEGGDEADQPESQGGPKASGSGFVIGLDDGMPLIMTNAHVVGPAGAGGRINVYVNDGSEKTALVLGYNRAYDLALVKLEQPCPSCAVLPLGDSDKLKVGEPVVAIGAPFGLRQSVTLGIVSQVKRSGVASGLVNDFIQTDAPINPGNSGGPLLDWDGNVLGVNTAIFSPTGGGGSVGVGFAVPAQHAKNLLARYRASKGVISSARIGVEIEGAPQASQLTVKKVGEKSPAEKAGLKADDVILKVDGQPAPATAFEFASVIANKVPSRPLKITVRRGQAELQLEVVPEAWQLEGHGAPAK